MNKTIKLHNQDNLPTAKYTDFIDLQGNLKTLPKEKQEKLKNSIINYGIRFPAFIWQFQDKKYIVDAHQRKKVFAILEKEGWGIPEVSYTNIFAKNKKEAAELLLQANSRYGEINPETSFFKDFDIGLEFMEEIEIPELELDFEGLGGNGEEVEHTKLTDKFIIPPFSVLDTRQGYWQDRKRAWIALGIKGELGRGELSTSPGSENTGCGSFGRNYKNRREADKHSNLKNVAKLPTYVKGGGGAGMEYIAPSTSIFDPVLAELGCKWFCPERGKILNPMCGESVMGVVAGYLGYEYTGFDIREEQLTSNKEQTDKILKGREGNCTWLLGDGADVDKLYKGGKADFIFSCPPYYNLEVYSDDKNDISSLQTYDEFIAQYQEIITKSIALLNDDRFACFVISDIRNKEGFYRNFVSDTIKCFINAGMLLYNEMILVHVAGSLPIRVANMFNNRKVGKMHENVLVFFKGDPKTIKDNYKEIQVE